jgi:peptide/nickel transport system substrate-binding protein
MRIIRAWLAAMAAVALAVGAAAAQPASDRPLRLVLNVGLQNLDPIAGPSFVTRNFAYMVWDTLVAMDGKGEYRPQMLDSWQASEDRLTWTFKLRPGLVWSDGAPVTAEDCVASLRRWGGRDGLGRRLLAATKDLRATATDTFVLELARPFGPVIEALGKPSVHVPFIMPARIASATPPTQQVPEVVGSGPTSSCATNGCPASAPCSGATPPSARAQSPRTASPAARSRMSSGWSS